ncbi:MAG: hypothetical protein IT293_05850 [Deltaproteobacteria bacterium]|nr:hypothetical protein [Deltaproteobacteria bacterium]
MTSEEVRDTDPCPDDERLGAFLEGRSNETERDALAPHVARCRSCLDVVAAGLAATRMTGSRAADAGTRASGTRPPRSSWRRLAWAATLAIALAGVALVAARRPVLGFSSAVARVASRWFDADVRIEAIRGRLGPSGTFIVGLQRLRYEHGKYIFTADEVAATVALASLVAGDSSLRRLVFVRPRLEVARPAIAVVTAPEVADRVLATLDAVERVDVVDGTVVLRDDASESSTLEGITGGMELRDTEGRIALRGRLGGGTLDVTGMVRTDGGPFVLTVAGREVSASALMPFGVRIEGRAEMRFDVKRAPAGVHLDGRVAVRGGRLVGGGPVQVLALDRTAHLALAAAAPLLAGPDLPFDELRAAFAWRRGVWRLSRVYVASGEVVAGGEVRVRADGDVEGRGTVRLPPALVREFAPSGALVASFLDPSGSAIVPFAVAGSVKAPRFVPRTP